MSSKHKKLAPPQAALSRREVFSKVRSAVVAIATIPDAGTGQQPDTAAMAILGSGFVVDRKGIVATARHVLKPWVDHAIANAGKDVPELPPAKVVQFLLGHAQQSGPNEVEVGFAIRVWSVRSIRALETRDLALLVIKATPETPAPQTALSLSTTPACEGDEVAICGYPHGRELHKRLFGPAPIASMSFTQGMVSAVLPDPNIPIDALTPFQMSAMISSGNSGGPVFDTRTGQVVGVVIESTSLTYDGIKTQKPAPQGGNPAEKLISLEVPIGLSSAEHIHHLFAQLKEARAAINSGGV